MRRACPVGHPSGEGRHCPLCGRKYVLVSNQTYDLGHLMPSPRVELVVPECEEPRDDFEAWRELSDLAHAVSESY